MFPPKPLPLRVIAESARIEKNNKRCEMRDQIAYGVLLTMLSRKDIDVNSSPALAEMAYQYADAMIAARGRDDYEFRSQRD